MDNSFSKYDIYATAESIYCYKGTNVLRNRFGTRNSQELREAENDITAVRQQDMLQNPIKGNFTINHLCGIHKYLFGDIYYFAGRLRKESIAKGETTFESPKSIIFKLTKLLAELKQENYLIYIDDKYTLS